MYSISHQEGLNELWWYHLEWLGWRTSVHNRFRRQDIWKFRNCSHRIIWTVGSQIETSLTWCHKWLHGVFISLVLLFVHTCVRACVFELMRMYYTGDDRRAAVINWIQSTASNDTDTTDWSVNEYLNRWLCSVSASSNVQQCDLD